MMWTKRRVDRLQKRAAEAQARIIDLFVKRAVPVGDSRFAWGQFLNDERDNTQYGIYGTSAGIQVLTLGGYRPNDKFVAGASLLIEQAFDDHTSNNHFRNKGDLFVLYKLNSIAEAMRTGDAYIEGDSAINEEIISRQLPGRGWGEYAFSDTERDEHPKLLPSACALLALRRYRPFRSSQGCEDVLRWLCSRVAQDGSVPTYQLALSTLSLWEYNSPGVKLHEYPQAIEFCRQQLVSWARARRRVKFGATENYHFTVRQEGRLRNRYLFFLTDCLVALALLELGSPRAARRYVLSAIDYFVSEIVNKYGFAPESTRLFSSVDHLWLYRLLGKFNSTSADLLLPQSSLVWSGASVKVRVSMTLLFLIVGLSGGYLAITSQSLAHKIIGGVLSAVGLGLLGRALWEFFLRGKSE